MQNHKSQLVTTFTCLIAILILSLSLSSCQPLRKKFTRKKKEKKEQFIPILDPVDYEQNVVSPKERYSYHYSLWQVWARDFINTMDAQHGGIIKVNDKKLDYLLSQMIVQLEEMKKWLIEEKQLELSGYVDKLHVVQEELRKPSALRKPRSIMKNVDRNTRDIKRAFKPKVVEEYYQGQEL